MLSEIRSSSLSFSLSLSLPLHRTCSHRSFPSETKEGLYYTAFAKKKKHCKLTITFCRYLFLDWVVNLDTVLQIGKRPAKRAKKFWVIGHQQWSNALVMVYV